MMHNIGILTSGGDAPGMNAAIRAVVRSALGEGYRVFAIYDGYKGLLEDNIEEIGRYFVSEIINRGGTKLRTARLDSFKDEEVRKQAVKVLKKHDIDTLVCIGGDGTYRGALGLSRLGIHCVCLPGTIDNDIASTEQTIGFDTALNTIVEAIDKLRDTSSSHQRCSIIEVMGRRCGDLAVNAGIASGAELIISSERVMNDEMIIQSLLEDKAKGKMHEIVVVTELLTDVHALAKKIEQQVGIECRATVLGHVQRGGVPSAVDRILASRMGVAAVDAIRKGYNSCVVGIKQNNIVYCDIEEALAAQRLPDLSLYRDATILR
ncbi:MAG: 6-phosphofructokinase [Bacilli bacterium]|nr:6-phosphofructokinase [Bacilli bacterium]